MKKHLRCLVALAAGGATALLLVSAAGGRAQTVSGSWVGTVRGTNAFVAIIVFTKATGGKHDVLVYICDSKKTAQWFRGQTSASHFTHASKSGDRIDVTISNGKASGTLTLPGTYGTSHPFNAVAGRRPAGLYRLQGTFRGNSYLAGWVVLPDGRQRGAVICSGATCQANVGGAPGLAISDQQVTLQIRTQNQSQIAQALSNIAKADADAKLNAIKNIKP